MRQTKAKIMREEVFGYCNKVKHPFPKRVFRKIKRLYNETPRILRNRFSTAQGNVI